MKTEKFKLVNHRPNILKANYSAKDIIGILDNLKINDVLTFYVECVGNTSIKYTNRLHLILNKPGSITIDIDKGSDGGTWSKNVTKEFIKEFFENIYRYTEQPNSHGFSYEQW